MSILKHTRNFFPFMVRLTEASQRRLNESGRILHEKKGRELLARGEFVGGAYLVMTGELDVYIIDRDGREASMYRVRAGESCLFAINSLFAHVPYPAWVRVTSSTATILMIPADVLKELHHQEKAIRDWVFGVQSQRIFDLVTTLEELQTLPVEARLRSYLLRSANAEHQIKETHEAIARRLGTAREVVTRHLQTFAGAGLLILSRGCIQILDAKRLGMPDVASRELTKQLPLGTPRKPK
ncbi:MAG TPA: Crp/Fnr family transcriptional regulator [Candidatus Limnocylindria bacterium]|nr:Crp/Fnr family transcriptional regulator [Candidatus Limnocylindria bacterium]